MKKLTALFLCCIVGIVPLSSCNGKEQVQSEITVEISETVNSADASSAENNTSGNSTTSGGDTSQETAESKRIFRINRGI